MVKNILTIDVEEYFQVENFKEVISQENWENYPSRLDIGVSHILEVLQKHNTTATFFILGWSAEQNPEVIKKIVAAGHEIGTHGYAHQLVYKQSPEAFQKDLLKSMEVIEKIAGVRVDSYRAPSFSITKNSLWALDTLIASGIRYDSSVFPILHDRYGMPEANPLPHVIHEREGHVLNEFPISTFSLFGKKLPFSGGGYFRLLPYPLIRSWTKKLNDSGIPVMVYLHPWEFDPDQPKVSVSGINRFRHYVNIASTKRKLDRYLSDFSFVALQDFYQKESVKEKRPAI